MLDMWEMVTLAINGMCILVYGLMSFINTCVLTFLNKSI